MPHWLIKSGIHRVISLLPRSYYWNELFQTHVTRSLHMSRDHFEVKLNKCRSHLDYFWKHSAISRERFTVLELGTGWYPILPAGMFLCGASKVWTFDICPLLNPSRLKRMLELFCQCADDGVLSQLMPRVQPDRVARLRQALAVVDSEPPEKVLERLDIHVRVANARNTQLPAGSIDFLYSSGVLDYIPYGELDRIFRELRRLATSDAVVCHHFGMQDQFADFDRSITRINFLQYSSKTWNLLASPLIWQNRLRISDYRTLLKGAGFKIVEEVNTYGAEEDLKKIRLAPEFQKYSKEELLAATTWLLGKPV